MATLDLVPRLEPDPMPASEPAGPESTAPESAGLESAAPEPVVQQLATVLNRRQTDPPPGDPPFLRLALSADDRTRLRGHRLSLCGRELLLQLERGEPLRPGEWLLGEAGDPSVRVEAALESLLLVRSSQPLALLQAAYHLGNRHVALELRPGELRLIWDPVLAHLLERRGLQLERRDEPFLPEPGAYAEGHAHAHSHRHGPDQDPGDARDHPGDGLDHDHALQHPPAGPGSPHHGAPP